MKKLLVLALSTALLVSGQPANAVAKPPLLNITCGSIEELVDDIGEYRRFNPTVNVTYTGRKLYFWVYQTTTRKLALSEQSRLEGSETRSTSATYRGKSTFDWHRDFHNTFSESRYFSSKYLEFTIVVKDTFGLRASHRCIYKFS